MQNCTEQGEWRHSQRESRKILELKMAIFSSVERLGITSTNRGSSVNAKISHLTLDLEMVDKPRNDNQQEDKQKAFRSIEHGDRLCQIFHPLHTRAAPPHLEPPHKH